MNDTHAVDYLLPLAEVRKRTGLSRSTIYRQMDAGRFPHPLKVGDLAVRWPESAITAWMSKLRPTKSAKAG